MGNILKPDKILFLILWIILSILASPGYKFWYLSFIQFLPFFYILKKYKNTWFSISVTFGFLYYIIYYKWLIYPVTFLDLSPFIFGTINVVLMALYQTIYFVIFSYFFIKLKNIFIIATIWGILELIRANIFTGFPWGELSYNLYSTPQIIQISHYIFSEGVSSFIIFVNLFLFSFKKLKNKEKIIGISIIFLFLLSNYIIYSSQKYSKPELKIAIIQGNIPEDVKINENNFNFVLEKYIELTNKVKNKDLIIWPEAIYTKPFLSDNSSTKKRFLNFIKNKNINLIFGSPTVEFNLDTLTYNYYNSMFLINSKMKIQRYDKIRLVPFGEYTPLKKILFFINKFVPGEDYSAGSKHIKFKIKNYTIIPLICYEGIFRKLTIQDGDFLVNISNEAWFGNSKALYQHIAADVFRAVESRKFFFKCANSGISAVISPRGEILKMIQPEKSGIIEF